MSHAPAIEIVWLKMFTESVHDYATLGRDVLVLDDGTHPENVGQFKSVAKFGNTDNLTITFKEEQLVEDGRGRGRIHVINNILAFSHFPSQPYLPFMFNRILKFQVQLQPTI